MAEEIVILTTIDRIALTPDEATTLLEHIRRDGGNGGSAAEALCAAIDEDGSVELNLTDESKEIALTAITAWLDTEGAWDVPGSVMDLRYELMRDLKIAPPHGS
jgi:hypothetical protein